MGWEDPNHKGNEDVGGAFGDDDPVDVVEIGASSLAMGSFTPVKVLGCLSMIDDGELDWKVIALNAADEHAAAINDVDDSEKALNAAETKEVIAETNGFYKKLLAGDTDAGK